MRCQAARSTAYGSTLRQNLPTRARQSASNCGRDAREGNSFVLQRAWSLEPPSRDRIGRFRRQIGRDVTAFPVGAERHAKARPLWGAACGQKPPGTPPMRRRWSPARRCCALVMAAVGTACLL